MAISPGVSASLSPSLQKRWGALAGAAIAAAVFAVYGATWHDPFVFDDVPSIVENRSIRALWPIGAALRPPGGGITVTGRPLLNLSFALNYACGGTGPAGYHLVNTAIHAAAALLLFGVVRRTLRLLGRRASASDLFLSAAVALLWAVHPLQTEAVTYVVQRAESLMGLFYFLTLYCAIRGIEGGAKAWYGWSVAACLAGMATKEVMVSAPVIVLLYDRSFAAGSFREAWSRRRPFYCGLAATWILLAALVLGAGERGHTAGFGIGVAAPGYWAAQFIGIWRYLRLAVWPDPLVFDYGDLRTGVDSAVLVSAAAVMLLGAAAIWAVIKRPAVGFLGGFFFAILAPTSVIPGARQSLAEHRMYLALAPVIVAAGFGLKAALGARLAAGWMSVVAAAAALLGGATIERNRVYRSELALWSDTAAKVPGNAFAQDALGAALYHAGQIEAAQAHFTAALALKPTYARANFNLANLLAKRGQLARAVGLYQQAVRSDPGLAAAHDNLGSLYFSLGRYPDAIREFEAAIQNSDQPEAHNNLGVVLSAAGQPRRAIAEFQRALELKPGYPDARRNLSLLQGAAGAGPPSP